jgi:peptide/nickel transport system permease protein
MTAYIVRRLGLVLVTVFGVAIITFVIAYLVPADPARMILGPHASPQTVAALRQQLGLNLPLWTQFGLYLGRLAQGNLGTSYYYSVPVSSLLWPHAARTAGLAIAAVLAELVIGIPVGIFAAVKRGSIWDRLVMVASLVGVSLPAFYVGVLLLYEVAFIHPILPLGGYGGPLNLSYYILPALTVGITGAAFYARLLRASILELVANDFVRSARSKGLSEAQVLFRHIIPNALIPFVTQLGLDLGTFMSGLIIIEQVFGWPGLGTLTYSSIQNLDEPTIMGVTIFAAFAIVLANLLVDICYAFLDPRISYS